MISLPIFRAKRLDSDEYVFGVPRQDSKGMYEMIINVVEDGIAGVIQRYIEVDTISIHFPDMLDSQGNKIFASLQKDGKGGDIVELQASSGTCLSCGEKLSKTLSVAIYEQMEFKEIELNPHECFEKRESNYLLIGNINYKKVIGIQQ